MFEGLDVEVNQKKVEETVAHLWAYVDAMMPASLYSQESRQKAVMDMTWACMNIVIAETERERIEADHES